MLPVLVLLIALVSALVLVLVLTLVLVLLSVLVLAWVLVLGLVLEPGSFCFCFGAPVLLVIDLADRLSKHDSSLQIV